MKYHQYLAVIMAGSLAACGGGSGSSGTTPLTSATLASSVASSASSSVVLAKATLAQGMVTGFGSVIVNGVHYDVKNAAIDVDGDSHVESELGVGQMLRIIGTLDADGIHGKATKVQGESQLRGAIASIDLTTGVIVALGQNILITADTFYQDGVTAATLKVGDVIKVSGYSNADGALVATRIEVKTGAAADITQLAGKIADLDTTALTFTLNGVTVNYSKATIADQTTLANDTLIRVRGKLVDGIFVAEGIQTSPLNIKNDAGFDGDFGFALGGLVTDLVANTSFKLNDATVIVNADTQYEGGVASDLANGLMVKIQGTLDANNNLVASKIKLILQPQASDNGLVQTVNLDNNTFSVNGITFVVTVDTSFNDGGRDKVRLFSLKDLAVGNTVNVRSYKIAATDTTPEQIIATRVERHNAPVAGAANFQVEVHGLVESVTDSTIKVAGHNVTLNADTKINGYDSLQAFLAAAVGLNVEIKGVIVDTAFVANNVELVDGSRPLDPRHSDSSHSANDSSMPAGGFPGHSESSHSARSEGAHSETSRSAMSARSEPAHSEASRSAGADQHSEPFHSESSRSAMSARSEPAHSETSRSAMSARSEPSRSSRSAMSAPSEPPHSESSRPAPTRTHSEPSQASSSSSAS